MKRVFIKGFDVAEIDIKPRYSFVSIGKENVEKETGFVVRTFLVGTALDCQRLLESKSSKGWRLKV